MKKYRVFYTVAYVLEVEAQNEEEALDIAEETDLAEYMHDTTDGDYVVEEIEE